MALRGVKKKPPRRAALIFNWPANRKADPRMYKIPIGSRSAPSPADGRSAQLGDLEGAITNPPDISPDLLSVGGHPPG